jgi:predicted RNase H-like nuclease (RuvC/YqgF family)
LPKKTRSQSSPAKPKDDMTSEGPTIADLTMMVQQLRLENRRLEDQLAERKIKVEELRDDLRLLRIGLSAKMKCLFEAIGHKDLY